jgi:hypothetical protein
MRMGLVVMCCKHIRASIPKLERRKIARSIAHGLPVRARRHGKQDIEYLTTMTRLRYSPPAELPGSREIAHGFGTGNPVPVLVFQFNLPFARDITQMPAHRAHTLGARCLVGDLDHHLRRAPERPGQLVAHALAFVKHAHMRKALCADMPERFLKQAVAQFRSIASM